MKLISAAVAGGIGACFGAPIGGVLFSLEVASYYFPAKTLFRSFFCALAAAYVARALNPFGEEHLILLSVDHDTSWHFVELVPFAALGVCGVGHLCFLFPVFFMIPRISGRVYKAAAF